MRDAGEVKLRILDSIEVTVLKMDQYSMYRLEQSESKRGVIVRTYASQTVTALGKDKDHCVTLS